MLRATLSEKSTAIRATGTAMASDAPSDRSENRSAARDRAARDEVSDRMRAKASARCGRSRRSASERSDALSRASAASSASSAPSAVANSAASPDATIATRIATNGRHRFAGARERAPDGCRPKQPLLPAPHGRARAIGPVRVVVAEHVERAMNDESRQLLPDASDRSASRWRARRRAQCRCRRRRDAPPSVPSAAPSANEMTSVGPAWPRCRLLSRAICACGHERDRDQRIPNALGAEHGGRDALDAGGRECGARTPSAETSTMMLMAGSSRLELLASSCELRPRAPQARAAR